MPIDFGDIQGLVRFGFGGMDRARFYLVGIRDAAAVRAWLLSAPVTTAVTMTPPPTSALQVAFSCSGLQALGVSQATIAGFAAEFRSGMTGDKSRSRRLGDVGANDPSQWLWGHANVPHLLIMLYAKEDLLDEWERVVKGDHWDSCFEVLTTLETSHLGEVEPFGFVDGISQPSLDWEEKRRAEGDQLTYSNMLALGEFMLGYPNEYAKYTNRPLIDPAEPHASELPTAEDRPDKKDLARNGTYLVMRQLQQDVRGFWQFLDKASNANPQERKRLAEAFVGRSLNGAPLVDLRKEPIEGTGPDEKDRAYNQFTYDADPSGARCPLGAHVRRANPRNADFPNPVRGVISHLVKLLGFGRKNLRDDLMAPTRFHRILRRGREYGPGLSPEDAMAAAPVNEPERGLHFICLNSNIARQFEFVQSAWLMSTKFDGLTEESDPLMGNREPVQGCPFTNTFSIPRDGALRQRITDLPQFITVRGGGYFFLPGIRALRYFARAGST